MLGASRPIFLSAPVLLEGLGTKYAGSAAGVISTLQLLGAVLIPTYILTPIAGDNYSLLFMLASICMVIMFLGNEFVKMIFVSFLNSNIYPLKNLPTSRVCIFLETPYSKASSHFPIASHLQ